MKLRFDDWMHRCLYDEKRGYYARQVKTVGRGGDFTTTPELSSALGKGIAAWVKEEWRLHGAKLPLIELGAGTGVLSAQVRKALGMSGRIGLKHGIVEVSAVLRAQQKERLGKKVQWFSDLSEALGHFNGAGLLFSNELVDAFPVRVFKKEGCAWKELFLEIQDGRTAERWEEGSPLPESALFSQQWQEGQRVEVHESYQQYLQAHLPALGRGSMMTVDYGDLIEEMYRRRPLGSIRAYFMQERLEGPLIYQNMGRQDLTADVNFTDLIGWSAPLETVSLCTQGEFLKPHAAEGEGLLNPLGAGNAFKVLLQRTRL